MSEFHIKQIRVIQGVGGFWVNDQPAIQLGARADGFFFEGPPRSPGFSAIREPSLAYCVMIELEDGQYAYGDCVTVLNLGYGGRPIPISADRLPAVQQALTTLFAGRSFAGFRSAAEVLDNAPSELGIDRPVAFGVSQALLSAAALAGHTTMARVLLDEYGLPDPVRPQLAGSCGGDWHQNIDKAIRRQVDMFPQSAIQTRQQCEALPEFVSWIRTRIETLNEAPGYTPDLHFDFHSSLGRLFNNDLDRVYDYLANLVERASPHLVYFEDPMFAPDAASAIENMVRLRARLERGSLNCRLIVDEWVNAPGQVEHFARAQAAHAFQIKTPDNGSLTTSIRAVQTCKAHGILPYLGGSCNETDISVRATVNVGLAFSVWRLLTRPGLGFDEGVMITTNELNRTQARLEMERPARAMP